MKKTILLVLLACVVGAFAADELQLSVGWTYDKNGRKRVLAPTSVKYTITGGGVVENVQTIATNATALTLGGVTNAGWAYMKNLSTNNYVEIGGMDVNTNFLAFLRLGTNEVFVGWLGTAAPYGKANTASIQLDYVIADK